MGIFLKYHIHKLILKKKGKKYTLLKEGEPYKTSPKQECFEVRMQERWKHGSVGKVFDYHAPGPGFDL